MAADRPLYIYGAGRMGREILACNRAAGREPQAFIDRDAERLGSIEGVTVIAPGRRVVDDSDVVVALHSPGVDVAGVVHELARGPFRRIDTLWSLCARSGWLPRSPFWLDPGHAWDPHASAIERARTLFTDEISRRVFDQQMALRRHGDYAGLDRPTPEDQYVPSGLARWRDPMHLLDAGAFDGDTIRAIETAGYTIEALLALEPDHRTFARLQARCGHRSRTRLLEAGAGVVNGVSGFVADEGGAAHMDAEGTGRIAVVAIDDVCDTFHPTLLKMDIEGAEAEALEGAAGTLTRDRPDLAISVYHRVHDLWTIPLAVAERVDRYRFALRSHAFNGFDTVLYGWAS